mmetsp:Transcript_33718/g.101807  ORF Transcript_33718/g.101807 Transcript_33718/m.101807 type:complete len:214 (+) Transcript_33718:2186-2827(+)
MASLKYGLLGTKDAAGSKCLYTIATKRSSIVTAPSSLPFFGLRERSTTSHKEVSKWTSVCKKYSKCSKTILICGSNSSKLVVGRRQSGTEEQAGSWPLPLLGTSFASRPCSNRRRHVYELSTSGGVTREAAARLFPAASGWTMGKTSHLRRSHKADLIWWFKHGLHTFDKFMSTMCANRQELTLMSPAASLNFWCSAWLKSWNLFSKLLRSLV